jgi:GTP-binding protein
MTASQNYSLCRRDGKTAVCKVAHIYGWQGLTRVERDTASAGEIVIVAGVEDIAIGETIADLENPRPLPPIRIDEPTVAMTFSVNNSPWAGREGDFVTSRKLGERIEFEARRNVSARVEQLSPDSWRVMGRGELQLAVIVETMRREGYEMQVSKPTVITKQSGGQVLEPMELLVIDIPAECIGVVTQMLSTRKGKMRTMVTHASSRVRLEYDIPARGLIGFRGRFLENTRGNGLMNTLFNGYGAWTGTIRSRANGAMISDRDGATTPYAIFHLQERGIFFVGPGEPVYEGMIVGEYARETNLPVNVCREKKLTNMRASGHDEAVRISPARVPTLDTALEWIDEEELVEVTPKSVRLRNRVLKTALRNKHRVGWTDEPAAAQMAESD